MVKAKPVFFNKKGVKLVEKKAVQAAGKGGKVKRGKC